MNKKHLNIILLGLLLVIWGAVLYKYFGKPSVIENTINNTPKHFAYSPKATFSKDTFMLQLINTNPFKTAKKSKKTNSKSKKAHQSSVKVKPKTKTNLKWPKIKYHGFVKSNNQNTRLILLTLDNTLYRKREKEIINGITLIKAHNDSLQVSYQNNTKYITKIHD
ncbi:hypothetical protein [Hyunsoonleella pacifica]|uniref:Type II secretion system protein GspC N-terminal domain-containing protein n=1 Tax=Hyunsoonleella pacifica TaxID=1080224 RepID=A0A4V2JAJ0_9FLAO|nr:hypothetical protein [Hyunsoonleella pacifica]TBN11958.1 hypothetical protein EYD46_17475 [Hyunsoonleella pacifica]GGD07610.1 hypothetical protein GCM10011368_06930 [Hyunsoonleella pacifica]